VKKAGQAAPKKRRFTQNASTEKFSERLVERRYLEQRIVFQSRFRGREIKLAEAIHHILCLASERLQNVVAP
jgi:hypothetical protein